MYSAEQWEGAITIDDPDGIVEDVRFCVRAECETLLADTFLWVREPLEDWLDNRPGHTERFAYRAEGHTLSNLSAVRL